MPARPPVFIGNPNDLVGDFVKGKTDLYPEERAVYGWVLHVIQAEFLILNSGKIISYKDVMGRLTPQDKASELNWEPVETS